MLITRDPAVITSFDDPDFQFLYSRKTKTELGEGWVLYTAIPHPMVLEASAIGAAADEQEPEPDWVLDDVENVPWYAVGSRWGDYLMCMKRVAPERCGGFIHASYSADPVLDDQGTEDESDDHFDMHGFVTCRTPG